MIVNVQEEINKNQKGGNNNRDSGLFGLDVPPKPEVGRFILPNNHHHHQNSRHPDLDQNETIVGPQTTEEPVSPSPRIGREVWSTDHEGSQIR